MKIAHIINPVNVPQTSDLYIAQPITFETMRRARDLAREHNIDVEMFFTCYEEDACIAPKEFISAGNLKRSALDVSDFSQQRKLPLIKDILDRLYEKSDADYFIYTNVDISLCERFYIGVAEIINKGYDSFVINRRTLSEKYTSVSELEYMYADKGHSHPGYDCFIFRRDAYPAFELGEACIGANWIGRVLLSNLIVNSDKFKVFEDECLTFHIGDDRSWKVAKYNDYDLHNQKIALSILRNIDKAGHLGKSKLLGQFKKQFEEEDKTRRICEENIFYKHIDIKQKRINQSPVFIVGFPRSGTTLLQSLVATQNILTFPETHYFNLVLNSIDTSGELVVEDYQKVVSSVEERYPLSNEAKDYIWISLKRSNLKIKKLFEILVIDGLLKQGVSKNDLSLVRWLEKTPSHAFKMQQISQYYPQAKFIYILRSPLEAFSSWRRVSRGWGQEAQPVEEYADLWIKMLMSAERFQKKSPENIKFISLEDLLDSVENVVGDLMLFIGNEFNVSALENRKNDGKHYILPNEKWKLSGAAQDINKGAASDKNNRLTQEEKIKTEYILSKYMLKYGYEYQYWNGHKNALNNLWADAGVWRDRLMDDLAHDYRSLYERGKGMTGRVQKYSKKILVKVIETVKKLLRKCCF